MVLIAPFTPAWDLEIERYFYQVGPDGNRHFVSNSLTSLMFDYGTLPAWITIIIASVMLVLSFFKKNWKSWHSSSLVIILTLAFGAGFLTHTLFKENWGRPRPKQVIEFGGIQNFRPFWEPNLFHQPEPSKSFPCGHCSMGFFFFSVALVGLRIDNKAIFWLGLVLAIVLGVSLSILRMAQGGHFLSDTLMSALIMWLTALTCDWIFYSNADPELR